MASIAAPSALRRLAALAVACCAVAAFAAEAPIVVKKRTRAGQEVLLRGFAEFDGQCRLTRVQSIVVARAPTGGSEEIMKELAARQLGLSLLDQAGP